MWKVPIITLLLYAFACSVFVIGAIKTIVTVDNEIKTYFTANTYIKYDNTNSSRWAANGPKQQRRVALARTFCEADAMDLLSSFDVWGDLLPCRTKPEIPVDLVISFSRDLQTSTTAMKAVEAVKHRFSETDGWNGCFERLVIFGVNITPELDLYRPKLQGKDFNWVNGPNRQFERTVRVIRSLSDNEYELMHLMEGDSVPLKPYWLDAFISEINEMKPFAILGSTYRGDKWDQFFNKLPSSLIHHTNGNAVYNISHPYFLNLLGELESEAHTAANNIAFDHRMQQIIQEGMIGIPSGQESFPNADPVPDRTAVFQQWNDQYLPEEIIKESKVNGNYAATNMVKELVNDDMFVIHGAKMYQSWDSKLHGDITLVVSDWSEGNSHQILSSLKESKHPFSKALVIQPDDSKHNNTMQTGIQTQIHRRGNEPDYMDFCTAPVSTEWFMMTNSYFRLKPIVTIMAQELKGKNNQRYFRNVVSTVEADNTTCFSHKACAQDLKIAQMFSPNFKQVFQSDNMLFKTSIRDEFCMVLKALPGVERLIATPATAYMAYIEAEGGGIHSLYKLSDRRRHGSRFSFVPLHEDKLPPLMASQHRQNNRRHLQDIGTNSTKCSNWVTVDECNSNGCIWRPDFMSCMEAPLADDSIETMSLDDYKLASTIETTNSSNTISQFNGNITAFLQAFGNFSAYGNMTPDALSALFGNSSLSEFFADTNNIYTLFGNASNFEAIFGTVDNFMNLFGIPQSQSVAETSPPTAGQVSQLESGSSSGEVSQPESQEVEPATEPPKEAISLPPDPGEVKEEAAVVEGPELCTVKVLVAGKSVKTMEIPCP